MDAVLSEAARTQSTYLDFLDRLLSDEMFAKQPRVTAAAILSRAAHHSHTFMVQGESYRLRQKRKAGLRLHSTPQMEA
jgi:DNA replication protein DnaC